MHHRCYANAFRGGNRINLRTILKGGSSRSRDGSLSPPSKAIPCRFSPGRKERGRKGEKEGKGGNGDWRGKRGNNTIIDRTHNR